MVRNPVVATPAVPKSVTAQDFAIAQMQATVFTPDEEVSGAKLMKGLLSRWQSRFDAEPFLLPVTTGVPREVPRVVMRTEAGDWRCEISSERMNLFWHKARPDSQVPETFANDAVKLLNEYIEFLRARVGRMAAVVTRYAQHPKPALFLARHFCQERWDTAPLNRPENFELHAHKTFVMADRFKVNSWVRNKTGSVGTEGKQVPVVVVEQDLNTLFEDAQTNSFSPADVGQFFTAAQQEFETIMDLYYPD